MVKPGEILLAELPRVARAEIYLALLAIGLMCLLLLVVIRLGAWSFKRKAKLDRGPSRMGPKHWAAMRKLKSAGRKSLASATETDDDEIVDLYTRQDDNDNDPDDDPDVSDDSSPPATR